MIRLIFTFLFCLTAAITNAQATAKPFISRDSLNLYCDKIMQNFRDAKFSEGMQMFKRHSLLDIATIDNMDKTMIEQMANVLPVYKTVVGYELIEEKSLKNTLVRRRYILKYENYFLTFDFILYNNGSGWAVSNFIYKDAPMELF